MHPAFSVVLFTTLSGLGYGLWIWTPLVLLSIRAVDSASVHTTLLLAAALPVAAGLFSSTMHLGKPLRSWRAFSQWRTSWLSREGVLAVAGFLPWAGLLLGALTDDTLLAALEPWLLMLMVPLSLATVYCTGMIYASLKPIPAWSHPWVPAVYIGFALLTGGLVCAAASADVDRADGAGTVLLLMLAVALGVAKRRYWRDIDQGKLPTSRASALGLPADRVATVFERPHTEANYLTTEMGYVLARKHSLKLRRLALVLFAAVPAIACAFALVVPGLAMPVLWLAALSALLGAMVERWLFFAEARHVVMLYY